MDEGRPNETHRVPVHGHEVVSYSFGDDDDDDVLLLVNGGPGVACDYIRDSHWHCHVNRRREFSGRVRTG